MAKNFFSSVGESFSKLTKKAAGGTENAIASARLKTKISEEHREIAKLYQLLGERVFKKAESGGTGSDEDEERIMGDIRGHLANIAALTSKAASLSGKRTCPQCGELVSADSAYCSRCGGKLPPLDADDAADEAQTPEGGEAGAGAADDGPFTEIETAGTEPEDEAEDVLDAEFQVVDDAEAAPVAGEGDVSGQEAGEACPAEETPAADDAAEAENPAVPEEEPEAEPAACGETAEAVKPEASGEPESCESPETPAE